MHCSTTQAKGKPYFGTESKSGVWYFRDRVTYEKDEETLKVTITFAHDTRRNNRTRVIMMKQDKSKYLEYDEITQVDTDAIKHSVKIITRTHCKDKMPEALPEELKYAQELAARSSKPNFRSSRSAIGHTLVMRGDLQLDAHSRLFHRHVRRHLLGFGHVHINMALDQHAHLNNLAVSESEKNKLRQKFGAISFEPGQATKAQGKVLVANAADLNNMKNEKQAGKQFTGECECEWV